MKILLLPQNKIDSGLSCMAYENSYGLFTSLVKLLSLLFILCSSTSLSNSDLTLHRPITNAQKRNIVLSQIDKFSHYGFVTRRITYNLLFKRKKKYFLLQ